MMDKNSNEENEQLELFIREWEEVSEERASQCNGSKYKRKYNYPTPKQMKKIWAAGNNWKSDFDIYRMLPTLWYCGYNGSLTIPPCHQRVVWRVLDLPMTMSKKQFKRIQKLIKNQLDENCKPNKTAYKRKEVSRPLQHNRNDIFCCQGTDWNLNAHDKKVWEERAKLWPDNYHGRENKMFRNIN